MAFRNTFIIHTENSEQEKALKAFVKALKMKFEVASGNSYDPEFIAKIEESEKEYRKGNYKRIKKEDLKSFLDPE